MALRHIGKISAQVLPWLLPVFAENRDEEGDLEAQSSRGREREICPHTTGAIWDHNKNFSFYYSYHPLITAPEL